MKRAFFGIAFMLMTSFVLLSCESEDEKLEKIEHKEIKSIQMDDSQAVDPEKVKPPKNG